jgi:hypothetical protein
MSMSMSMRVGVGELSKAVIPAKAGTQFRSMLDWAPAFAGVTKR